MPSVPPTPPGPPRSATTGSLAHVLNAELVGSPTITVDHVVPIERPDADPTGLTFIRNAKFAGRWATSGAAAAIVTRGIEVAGHDPQTRALLLVENADLALIALLELMSPPPTRPGVGIHPSALVDASAQVDPSARIGPWVSVGPGSRVGPGAVLHPRVGVGAGCEIGQGAELHAGVTLYDRCRVGDRSILHAGVVIGADGFGYRPDPATGGHRKIPHIGGVRIGADVEIGANSCVDRGKIGDTVIGDGTKIDNLVQIGHNCTIGRGVIICGLCGIAGSVTIGDGTMLAGASGVADNLTVGAGAIIGAKSGVMCSVPANETWFGYPARPKREAATGQAIIRRLALDALSGRNERRDKRQARRDAADQEPTR